MVGGWIVTISVASGLFVAGLLLGARRSRAAGRRASRSDADSGHSHRAASRLPEAQKRLATAQETGALLHELAEVLGGAFDCTRVVIRLFNPRTRLYEARAFHGLAAERVGEVSTLDVTAAEFTALTSAAACVGSGWRVRDPGAFGAGDAGADPLLLPLRDDHDTVIGYACVRDATGAFDDEETRAQWDVVARAAASELQRTRLRAALQRRDLEYAIVSEQLREWQSMRDNFVSNISHELRTPLTSVKAYTETLARGLDTMDPAVAREFVGVIEHEAARLEQVFDDLLDVAHLEGRGRRIARDRIDLRAVCEEVCRTWRPRFEAHEIELTLHGATEGLWIQGDVDGIRQVVDGLLSNALKFSTSEGAVRVELDEDAGTAQIAVCDTGIGVPEQERLRIFERFYQVDSSSTRAYGGQGLGLALCREIVGWHHGRIWVEDGDGGGSRFVVNLPVRGLVVRQHAEDPDADGAERAQWESFLQLAIHLVSELLGTRIASIMLVDELHDTLRVEAAVGLDEDVVQTTMIGRGEGVAGVVWRDARSVLVPDLDADAQFRHLADDLTYRPRSLLSVPLFWNDRVVGVLNVNTKYDGLPFDDDDRVLLEALAERIMVAIESFERYRTGYRRLAAVESGVRAMLDVGRERRTRLREALARVGVETGRRLGLDDAHLRALAYTLRTYDLGLAEVNSQLLRKDTPLTPEEREHIDRHAQLGAELAAGLEPSPVVRKMILHHHENFDGSGYPEGLRGEAIPVGARIVRLADAFSALLHDRPFRSALSLADAMSFLRDGVGSRFCPRVTPVFLDAIDGRRADVEALLGPATEEHVREQVLERTEAPVPTGDPDDGAPLGDPWRQR